MKHLVTTIIISLIFGFNGFAQETKKFDRFKVYSKDTISLKKNYQFHLSQIDVKKGEKVASVGAGNGDQELQISIFNEDIDWTLQDIDSIALNRKDFNEVLHYFEDLTQKSINEKFSFIIGNEKKTNLPEDTYDKILIINTYHEITERASILTDIHRALKKNGKVIIVESMAKKKGQRHAGCHDLKLLEPDFLREMEEFNFKFLNKVEGKKRNSRSYYTFESI
jgi:ubiquinone/menaquinone biosynthesis C-methylase UbiE